MANETKTMTPPPTTERRGVPAVTWRDVLAEWVAAPRRLMGRPPRYHYFAFCFSSGAARASVYIGWPDKRISLARIGEARKGSGIETSAVLESCCYLGRMTREQMTGEAQA